MKQLIILFTLGVFLLSACSANGVNPSAPPPQETTAPSPIQVIPNSLSANGILMPARELDLGFGEMGMIKTVHVRVGDQVQAGQVLMELDNTVIQLEIEQAKRALNELLSPASIAEAEQAVAEAKNNLEDAQNKVDSLSYQRASDELLKQTQNEIDLAKEQLAIASNAYKQVAKLPDGDHRKATASLAMTNAQINLNTLIAKLNWYTSKPTEIDADMIRASLDAATASLQETQWYLAALKGEQIPLAATGSKLSQLRLTSETLQAAEKKLERFRLVAPIDGVVAALKIDAFEWTTPGATVIQLLDVSHWRLMTRNVGELQIGRIKLGQETQVVVNAFRNDELTGQIAEIAPDSTVQQGDVTYTLWIELDPTDLNLRPGMTAQVVIITEP